MSFLPDKPRRATWRRIYRVICFVVAPALLPVFTGVALAEPSTDAGDRPPNVVILLFDTLRADHLGCYGYERGTSPHLDRLAGEGIRFSNAYAQSSFTRESVVSLFTGCFPSRGGYQGWDAEPRLTRKTLAEHFSNAGYRTGLFSISRIISKEQFTRGFDTSQFLAKSWAPSGGGPELADTALSFITDETSRKKPFFAYLHFMDPHGPYAPPAAFRARFPTPAVEKSLSLYDDVRPHITELVPQGFGPGEARFEDLIARYDAEVAHSDFSAQYFLDGLAQQGLLENTIVIVTADHGEEFLEHGFVEHAWTLHEEVIRIPLILHWPKRLGPTVEETPVSLVDVAPTLLTLAGIPFVEGDLDGRSLIVSGEGSFTTAPSRRPIICELLPKHRVVTRAVIHEGFKYIATIKPLSISERQDVSNRQMELIESYRKGTLTAPGFWDSPREEQLFDLEKDPTGQTDLLEEAPEVARRLRALLQAYQGQVLLDAGTSSDPTPTVREPVSEDEVEALETLGYL